MMARIKSKTNRTFRLHQMRGRLLLAMFAVSVSHECTGFTVWQRCVQCMLCAVCVGSFGAAFAKCLWPLVKKSALHSVAYFVFIQSLLQYLLCQIFISLYLSKHLTTSSRAKVIQKISCLCNNCTHYKPLYPI